MKGKPKSQVNIDKHWSQVSQWNTQVDALLGNQILADVPLDRERITREAKEVIEKKKETYSFSDDMFNEL